MSNLNKHNLHFHHWVIWGLVIGLIIYLGALLFPNAIVLGNATVSNLAAVILASLIMTLASSLMPLLLKQLNLNKLSTEKKYLADSLMNIIILWLMSRLALVFGFGLISKFTAFTLGLIITFAQYIYWEFAVKKIN